jgi:hypothetical protein
MVVEVDVQPLAASRARTLDRAGNEPRTDAAALDARADQCVENEGVRGTVPRDVDEADQVLA